MRSQDVCLYGDMPYQSLLTENERLFMTSDLIRLYLKYSQGKSFIKDALKCMAHGLRHKFSCISRKCLAIKEMVFQLQRECYMKHNLCSAAKDNVNVMVEMIHFQDLFPKGQVSRSSFTLLSFAHTMWFSGCVLQYCLRFCDQACHDLCLYCVLFMSFTV